MRAVILVAPKVVIARAAWRASAEIPGFAIPVLQAVLEVDTEIHLSAPEPRTHGTSCRHTKHHPKQSTKVFPDCFHGWCSRHAPIQVREISASIGCCGVAFARSLSCAPKQCLCTRKFASQELRVHECSFQSRTFRFLDVCFFGLLGPRCVRAMASYPCNSCDCSTLLSLSAMSRITSF